MRDRIAEAVEALRGCLRREAPREVRAMDAARVIREAGPFRWVGLYEVHADEIAVLAWDGPSAPSHPRFPVTQGLNGAAVSSRKPVIVQDVSRDPRYLATLGSTMAEMIVPVRTASGAVVGTIEVESERVGAFTQADQALLEACAPVLLPLWPGEAPISDGDAA